MARAEHIAALSAAGGPLAGGDGLQPINEAVGNLTLRPSADARDARFVSAVN